MIRVEKLKKSFDGVEVLKGISVTFQKGQTNLIIGQSGSGKTVFLKCLLGLIVPSAGDIFFDDIHANALEINELQKLRNEIGTVFQGSALFDSVTVEENVRFPLDMFAEMANSEKEDRVANVLKRVNLVGAENKFPSEISGGMQKRVAIARAIVNNPKYLFCDEPNSGLDPQTSILIDDLIHEITTEYNTTTVINTHDMNSVMEIGEHIIFLKNGVKAWEGNNREILVTDNEAVVEFVYSSKLARQLRDSMLGKNK